MEDSALVLDSDFIFTHIIAPTHHQNHHEYHCSQSSEVRVASKTQAKNKRSPLSLIGNEYVMICLGTTETSSSEESWEGRGAASVFLKTHIQKIILYTLSSPMHHHVPLSYVPLGRKWPGRTLKKWLCSSQLRPTYFLTGCHKVELYSSLSYMLSLGKCWKCISRDTSNWEFMSFNQGLLKISVSLLVWAASPFSNI